MSTVFAPEQLSIAPRPLTDELLSSWLLRTAAANAISLKELLDGFQLRYPDAQLNGRMLDYSLSETALRALSRFTRVPLDWRQVSLFVSDDYFSLSTGLFDFRQSAAVAAL